MGVDAVGVGAGGGGFEGESGSPEAVGMAVLVALALETNVAAGGHGLANGTEIGGQKAVVGDAEAAGLEGAAELVGEFFFKDGVEGEAFDAVAIEFFPGALNELTAETGLVNAGPPDCRQCQQGIKHGFLGFEGLLLEANDFAGVEDVAQFFHDPDDGEVAVAADVNADEEL